MTVPSDYFSAIEQSEGTLILVLLFMGLCFLFVGVYFYVQRPKNGTIEWIGLYERGRLEPFAYEPLVSKDIWVGGFSFLTALTICSCRFIIHYKLGLISSFGKSTDELILYGSIVTFLLSAAFYVFFRLFFTSRFVAFLVTCLSCALYSNEINAVILLLFSWSFLYVWICCSNREYKRIHALYLVLSGVIYLITLMACWATFYLFPIYLSGFIIGKVLQQHPADRERSKGKDFLYFLFFIIACSVGVLLMWLLYYSYKNENVTILTAALSGNTYYSIIPTFLGKMADIALPKNNGVEVVRQDLFRPILFITSLIPSVYGAFVKKKSQALTAVVCAFFFLVVWIFAGVDIMCPGAMLSIGWMFKGFRDRGYRRYAVYISLIVLIFYYFSLLV